MSEENKALAASGGRRSLGVLARAKARFAKLYACPPHLADIHNSANYIPNLDGLRAVSILIVLCSHFITNMIPGGLGVYVFFVISGFLIARQFFNEKERAGAIDRKNFYVRRVFRLYPVALVYTAVVLVAYALLGMEIDWWQPASAIFYFSNYLYADLLLTGDKEGLMPFLIFWSLSVEEHFYLLFPTIFVLLGGNARKLGIMLLIVIVGALLLRTGIAWRNPDLIGTRYFYYRSEFRIDSIAYGVAIAVAGASPAGQALLRRVANPASFIVGLSLMLFCLLYRDPFFRETLRYSLNGIGITLCVVSVLFSARLALVQALLNNRVLVYIGKLSYSLYLWHLLAPIVTEPLFGEAVTPVSIVVNFALAFAVSSASYHLLEIPFLKLRKKFH